MRTPATPRAVGSTAVLILAGGGPVPAFVAAQLPPVDYVIAADSGARLAAPLGVDVHLLVGDFDSLHPDEVARLGRTAEIERHPPDKDKTDIELALDAAVRRGADDAIVVAGTGGRLDHGLANVLLLSAERYAGMRLRAYIGAALVTVVRGRRELTGEPGDLMSLVAVGGPARGVTTVGLRYRLVNSVLHPGSTRGISNVFHDEIAVVEVRDGVVLAIQPIDSEETQ